jgi:uncharacterized tellurite resistance protein B-like protein
VPFPDDVNPLVPGRVDRLRIAFAVRIAQRITEADGVLDAHEVDLLTRCFPAQTLQRAGFLDSRRALTPEVDTVFRQALVELPRVLTTAEKLELVTLFHRTAAVDGELHPSELSVLEEGAAMLELPHKQLLEHLRHLGGRQTLIPR